CRVRRGARVEIEQGVRTVGAGVGRDECVHGPITGTPGLVQVAQGAVEQSGTVVRTDQDGECIGHGFGGYQELALAFSPKTHPERYPRKYATFISLRTVVFRPRAFHCCSKAHSARQSCGIRYFGGTREADPRRLMASMRPCR